MVVRRWVAALLALPLLVSCADGEASSDPDKPTPSVTSTESETPTGPDEPELFAAARKPTEAGAIAFVKHYWASVYYAQSTGDLTGLTRLSSQHCELCRGGVRGLRKLNADGGRLKGSPPRMQAPHASLVSQSVEGKRSLIAHVRHTLLSSPSVAFYGKGDPRNRRFKGGTDQEYFLLAWQSDGSGWLITDWSVQ